MKTLSLENSSENSSLPLYLWAVQIFLSWFIGLLALLTIITHTAQIFQWSFQFYALLSAMVIIGGTFLTIFIGLRLWRHSPPMKDGLASLIAAFLMIIPALLTLFIYRPDGDDYYYVPSAVYALNNPAEPLGFIVHGLIPADGKPIISYNFCNSLPYEYLSAILAYFSGIEYLSIYYFLMPMLVSATIIAALIYLVGQFNLDPLTTVLGCVIAFFLLLLMGETHRSYGNFTFTRAFQAKTLLLSAGIPLLAAITIKFFRKPQLSTWFLLAATTVAMVGVSSSAMVLLPFLALILVIASLSTYQGNWLNLIPQVVIYGCGFFYLLGYAAIYIATGYARGLGLESPVNTGFPSDFTGHLALMISEKPFWPIIALVSASLFLFYAKPREKLFMIIWIALCLILYLNPVVAPFLIEHVTSPNIYWRLYYLLPVVPLSAIATALALKRIVRDRSHQVTVATIIVALTVAAHWLIPQASIFRVADIGRPRYNLPLAQLAEARAIIAKSPPAGPMIAPSEIGRIIPMLSGDYPQILLRTAAEWLWLDDGTKGPVTTRRKAAVDFVAGKNQNFADFFEVVQKVSPSSIILKPKAWDYLQETGKSKDLTSMGFSEPQKCGSMLILNREF